ncbi:alpha/beta fold hydrolase [Rhodovulum sp. YNF3179]|uniref:alpha/beta fold hydrolase n=1 Tax=Rhodovulum sp. YNF3179 TaxID=3425127 RepID=UPI003D34AC6A
MDEPLVLLPGMMCDARLFGPQIAALSATTTLHLGRFTRGETIEDMAAQALAAAPARFALAGHSMGAMVAMEMLRRAPERVSRLALMNTSPLAETPAAAAAREPQIARARAGHLEEALGGAIGPEGLAPGARRAEVMDLLRDMARRLGPEVFVRQARAMQRRPDQQATLRRAKVPVLILCGEMESLYPVVRHELMAALVPGAELQVIAGAGHAPSLEQPRAVTEALARWMRLRSLAGVRQA